MVAEWQTLDRQLIGLSGRRDRLHRQLAELDNKIRRLDDGLAKAYPNYSALALPEALSVIDAKALIHEDEALVQFGFFAGKVYVWVLTSRTARWTQLSEPSVSISILVQTLRCGLDPNAWGDPTELVAANKATGKPRIARGEFCKMLFDDASNYSVLPFAIEQAHELYESLLAPVQELIKDKHLLIVPSGPLTQLPFQVLVARKPDEPVTGYESYRRAAWLSRSNAITVLPTVASLKVLRQQASASRATRQFLGIGNPFQINIPGIRLDIDQHRNTSCFQYCNDAGNDGE